MIRKLEDAAIVVSMTDIDQGSDDGSRHGFKPLAQFGVAHVDPRSAGSYRAGNLA